VFFLEILAQSFTDGQGRASKGVLRIESEQFNIWKSGNATERKINKQN
jgi:hypothetical protein